MGRLYRDQWDKKVAGVCGGLGQYFKIDPTIIRLLLLLACIFTGILPFATIYIIMWLVVPLGPPTYIEFECKKLYRLVKNRKVSGICAGIAEMLSVSATVVRLAVIVAMIITGFFPILCSYFIGTFIIPEKSSF